MFDPVDIRDKGGIVIIALSMLMIFSSGIFFGISYFVLESVEDGFLGDDCVIDNNYYVDSCQELWELAVYPFTSLRYVLIYGSYFFLFGQVLAMLVLGYRSGKSPALMGIMTVAIAFFTYASIILSNIYRRMIEVAIFREIMIPFTVYNRIMVNFPWFIFIISLSSVVLAIVNWQRVKVNSISDTNY